MAHGRRPPCSALRKDDCKAREDCKWIVNSRCHKASSPETTPTKPAKVPKAAKTTKTTKVPKTTKPTKAAKTLKEAKKIPSKSPIEDDRTPVRIQNGHTGENSLLPQQVDLVLIQTGFTGRIVHKKLQHAFELTARADLAFVQDRDGKWGSGIHTASHEWPHDRISPVLSAMERTTGYKPDGLVGITAGQSPISKAKIPELVATLKSLGYCNIIGEYFTTAFVAFDGIKRLRVALVIAPSTSA